MGFEVLVSVVESNFTLE